MRGPDTTPRPRVRRSLFEILGQLPGLVGELIKAEIEQIKADIATRAKQVGIGAGLFAGAAFILFFAFGVLLAAAVAGLAVVLPVWASALIVGGALLIIAVVLALVGVSRFKAAGKDSDRIKESIQSDIRAIKGIGRTQAPDYDPTVKPVDPRRRA